MCCDEIYRKKDTAERTIASIWEGRSRNTKGGRLRFACALVVLRHYSAIWHDEALKSGERCRLTAELTTQKSSYMMALFPVQC